MTHVINAPTAPGAGSDSSTEPHLGWVLAGLSAGAGVIHFVEVPAHAGGTLLDPLGFAAFGWFQLMVAAAVLTGRAGRRTYAIAAVGNIAALGFWIWSRTVGLPFGTHKGMVESVGLVGATCALLEVGVVVIAVRLLLSPERRTIGRLAPALVAVAALSLTTSVITSPDATSSDVTAHSHGVVLTAHDAAMVKIDETRCDNAMNIPAYEKEATYLGVDTRMGDTMAADTGAAATSAGGHNHGGTAAAATGTTTTEPDPTAGRGSATLDELVADTSLAAGGEGAAARLVVDLGKASDKNYGAWLWWLRSSGSLSHSHAATTTATASGDTGGHGGHVGPQPWVALTNPADCRRLDAELAEARKVAMQYPTAADATKAGYYRVTTYVPGIAAHYMKFKNVDGKFDLDEPEMVLYDGNGPDAHVVGLSYYLIQPGSSEPTQGFTGANDHGHRHIGLCTSAAGVIGDSTLTKEECAARGGVKSDGSDAWMIHAWVVPGCESPWGVFSAASPILDGALAEASGKNDGGCSASAVRGRYGMGGESTSKTVSDTSAKDSSGSADGETAATTGN